MSEDQELSPSRDVAPTPSVVRRKHRPGLQRVSIACERCRKRKNKCDRKLPECSTCKAAGAECVISDRVTNRQYPRAHVDGLENEVQELRSRVKELELQLGGTTRSYSNYDQLSASAAQTDSTPKSACATEKTTTSPFNNISAELSTIPHDVTSSQRYVGESSGLFFGKVVEAVLLHSDYKGEQGPSSESLRVRVAGRPKSSSFETFAFPPPELAYRMQAAYFTCWWPALPFLHASSFVNEHLAPTLTEPQPNKASVFLSLMVLALGTIELRRKDPEFGNSHLDLFRCATQNYLSALLKEDNIMTIQGLLLMSQFSVNEHESANAWLITGQAVRTAIDLGLHRSHIVTPSESVTLGTEMRKRVFWCTYALDRNVSIALGRPCAIRDEDIDVPFPLNLTDVELQDGLTIYQATTRARSPLDMSTFIHILELRRIQSRIQALFYSADTSQLLTRGVQYSQVEIRSQLDEWIAKSPRYTTPTTATFQSTEWFEIACSHAMLLLYRPSPACPIIDAVALQICADSSISLISSYSSLYAKNKITYTWIALHSLFMASITMLYTLAVSPNIRASTTKAVVRSNVASCLALFQVMAEYWPLAARCHEVIVRFGNFTVTLFDKPFGSRIGFSPHSAAEEQASEQHFGQISLDFMEWFDTRDRQAMSTGESGNCAGSEGAVGEYFSGTTAAFGSFEMPLDDMVDMFQSDFDMTLPIMMAGFGYDALLQPLPHVPSPSHADTSDVPKVPRRGSSNM